jgi:hypothetical protein
MTRRRRARSRAVAVVALVVGSLVTGCAAAPAPGYVIVFADEFDGTEADPAVWATAPFGGSLAPTVADGALTLRSTAANSYRWGYLASTGPRHAGEPSYPEARAFQEGYVEARLRYTDDPWVWPAFWLFSMAKTEAWPGEDCSRLNAEWDVMENGIENGDGSRPASSWYFGNLHRNAGDGTPDGYCGTPNSSRPLSRAVPNTRLSDWHVWAGRWTADEMCTYLDGVELGCVATYDSTAQPMHLTFSLQYLRACAGCGPRPRELHLVVDWVRVWQLR